MEKLKIGIIGVGHIGKTLTLKLSGAGHDVKIANSRGPHTIESDVLASGARALEAYEVVERVDVVIISIPLNRIPEIAPLIKSLHAETVVIDTSNYYPLRDSKIKAIESGMVESLWVAEQLGRPIAKAWNSILADSFARKGTSPHSPDRIALSVAADRDNDRRLAMQLVEETGFDALDAGPLSQSWRQQPGAPCYCTDLKLNELRIALMSADRERLPQRRDLAMAVIMERFGDGKSSPDGEYLLRVNRTIYM